MRIEEAIRVSAFPSERQKLSINLIYTTSWADIQLQQFFGEFGVTSAQYNVLRILRGAHPEPMTTSAIQERMIHRNAGASRLVDRLVGAGTAIKMPGKSDRRLVDVWISAKGLSVLEEMDAQKERIDQIYGGLSDVEVAQLNSLLDKLREAARE
ncbi:MAG: DNA-binding MarR family transcriptional regulator [Rhodothermales bacterium]|jgi:DNA-binding MarR family transcriptional regulator